MTRVFLALLIWVLAVPLWAQRRTITHEDVYTMTRTGDARPSADGRWVVFILNEPSYDPAKAVSDLWIVASDGSCRRRGGAAFTTAASSATHPKWRRDGKALLFEGPIKAECRTPDASTARVFDVVPIRFWNTWNDGSKPHIFVQPVDGGPAVDWLAGTTLAQYLDPPQPVKLL